MTRSRRENYVKNTTLSVKVKQIDRSIEKELDPEACYWDKTCKP